MGNSARPHLIIAVHGIRTFGRWQDRLEKLVRQAGNPKEISFHSFKLRYFSVAAFLFPPLRWLVVRRFRNELRRLAEMAPRTRIDLVGHSFGTHVIAWALWGLKPAENISIHTIILAGSVLRGGFHWSGLIGSRVGRVINDCGTKDVSLLFSQFCVLFTGMAGHTGFSGMTGESFRNRFSAFGHSGYFQDAQGEPSDAYMARHWVDLLVKDEPIPDIDERSEGGVLRGIFYWLANNAEPVKLSVYLSPMIALVVWILSLYVEADKQRLAAEQQTLAALRSQSETAELLAKQKLAEDPEGAIAVAVGGLPLDLSKPERPLLPGLIDVLDAALSAQRPRRILPVSDGEMAIDQAGKRLAIAAASGEIQFWDVASGNRLGVVTGHPGGVQSLAFSPDGRLLVSTGADDRTSVWALDGSRLVSSHAHPEPARDARFTADAARVFSLLGRGGLTLWDVATGKLVREWPEAHAVGESAAFKSSILAWTTSADGRYFVTGGGDRKIRIWSGDTASMLRAVDAPSSLVVRLDMGSGGRTLVSTNNNRTATVWSFPDGEPRFLAEPITFKRLALSLSLSPDENTLALADSDAHLIDLRNGRKIKTLPLRSGDISSLAFSPDGALLLSAANGAPEIRVWRTNDQGLQDSLRVGNATYRRVTFGLDDTVIGTSRQFAPVWHLAESGERRLRLLEPQPFLDGETGLSMNRSRTRAAGRRDGSTAAAIWDLEKPAEGPILLSGHRGSIASLRFSDDGGQVVTASGDGSAILWDARTGKLLQRFVGHSGQLQDAIILKENKRVLTNSRDGTARLWDVESGAEISVMKGKYAYLDVVITGDERYVVGLDDDRDAVVWRAADGTVERTIAMPRGVETFKLTPDGRTLVVALDSGTMVLYGLADGKQLKRFSHHTSPIKDIDFSGDRRRMITTSADGLAVVWDLQTFESVSVLLSQVRDAWGSSLDERGQRAVIAGGDGTVVVWRPDSGVVLRRASVADLKPHWVHANWKEDKLIVLGAEGAAQEIRFSAWSDRLAHQPGMSPAKARPVIADYARAIALPLVVAPPRHPPLADAEPPDECDTLAAHPFDPDRQAPGLPMQKVDAPLAEAACRRAVAASPRVMRFHYQLGRALALQNRRADAIPIFRQAASGGYRMANIGLWTTLGDDVAALLSREEALKRMNDALDKGVGIAGYLLAREYWEGRILSQDRGRALQFYSRAAALGDPYSHQRLSELNEFGELVPWNLERALYHQILAAAGLEELGLDSEEAVIRRSSLARRLDPMIVSRISQEARVALAPRAAASATGGVRRFWPW